MQLQPGQLAHVLDVWPVARLATVSRGGAPHAVPLVFVRIDADLYSPIDAKPKSSGDLQRLRNIAHDARVCLLLDHYDADWRRLWWLRIDAVAERLAAFAPADLARVTERLRSKYPQYRSTAVFRDDPLLLRIRPTSHTAWSAEPIAWEHLT